MKEKDLDLIREFANNSSYCFKAVKDIDDKFIPLYDNSLKEEDLKKSDILNLKLAGFYPERKFKGYHYILEKDNSIALKRLFFNYHRDFEVEEHIVLEYNFKNKTVYVDLTQSPKNIYNMLNTIGNEEQLNKFNKDFLEKLDLIKDKTILLTRVGFQNLLDDLIDYNTLNKYKDLPHLLQYCLESGLSILSFIKEKSLNNKDLIILNAYFYQYKDFKELHFLKFFFKANRKERDKIFDLYMKGYIEKNFFLNIEHFTSNYYDRVFKIVENEKSQVKFIWIDDYKKFFKNYTEGDNLEYLQLHLLYEKIEEVKEEKDIFFNLEIFYSILDKDPLFAFHILRNKKEDLTDYEINKIKDILSGSYIKDNHCEINNGNKTRVNNSLRYDENIKHISKRVYGGLYSNKEVFSLPAIQIYKQNKRYGLYLIEMLETLIIIGDEISPYNHKLIKPFNEKVETRLDLSLSTVLSLYQTFDTELSLFEFIDFLFKLYLKEGVYEFLRLDKSGEYMIKKEVIYFSFNYYVNSLANMIFTMYDKGVAGKHNLKLEDSTLKTINKLSIINYQNFNNLIDKYLVLYPNSFDKDELINIMVNEGIFASHIYSYLKLNEGVKIENGRIKVKIFENQYYTF